MARKARPKSAVDKQQQKDINLLKRLIPTQREIVETANSSTPVNTGTINRLYPSTLDSEKIFLSGIDFRGTGRLDPSGTTPVFVRIILFIYKCDVVTGAVVDPTPSDILEMNHGINGLQNVNNSSRIRVLYDTTYSLQPPGSGDLSQRRQFRKFFKNQIKCMAITDKAFVHRPFSLVVGATNNTNVSPLSTLQDYNCNLHTVQMPN